LSGCAKNVLLAATICERYFHDGARKTGENTGQRRFNNFVINTADSECTAVRRAFFVRADNDSDISLPIPVLPAATTSE
jgi:hypothetical protein